MGDNHQVEYDPLQPHTHDPNPEPPGRVPTFTLIRPDGSQTTVTVPDLRALTLTTVPGCFIVSTSHGTSGPFAFSGATLLDLLQRYADAQPWSQVEVISADGFGNRVFKEELLHPDPAGPILLAHTIDGEPMTRQQGLVRLIVPSEKDDALRQVKWIDRVCMRA